MFKKAWIVAFCRRPSIYNSSHSYALPHPLLSSTLSLSKGTGKDALASTGSVGALIPDPSPAKQAVH